MAKKRQHVDQDEYNAILDHLRANRGNLQATAAHFDRTYPTIQKLWERGLPSQNWGLPIRDVLEDEEEEARALRQKIRDQELAERRETRKKAKEDALKTNEQESRLAVAARENAILLAHSLQKLLGVTAKMAEKMAAKLASADLTAQEYIKMLHALAIISGRSVEVIEAVLRIERTRMGDPIAIIGIRGADMSTEDALAELRGVSRTLERAQKLGFKVLEGGKG